MLKNQWQRELTTLIRDPETLFQYLQLDEALVANMRLAHQDFPLRVPRGFADLIEKGNANDPLLKQILAQASETLSANGFCRDPLDEIKANKIPGVLHKYQGRVLVTLTSACAIHCRYCFRRHFPYANNKLGTRDWEKIFAYLKADESIHEVILSGGDPLTLTDKVLDKFTQTLLTLTQIKRLRFHTRVPIVLPARITQAFCAWIKQMQSQLACVVVVHANHPNELSEKVLHALKDLAASGATLLNQSVLLKGVNDDADCLRLLSEKLFAARVLPYYLHVLDKVSGTQHFEVDIALARQLHAGLRDTLPGYLVPRLVREDAGLPSKTWL